MQQSAAAESCMLYLEGIGESLRIYTYFEFEKKRKIHKFNVITCAYSPISNIISNLGSNQSLGSSRRYLHTSKWMDLQATAMTFYYGTSSSDESKSEETSGDDSEYVEDSEDSEYIEHCLQNGSVKRKRATTGDRKSPRKQKAPPKPA